MTQPSNSYRSALFHTLLFFAVPLTLELIVYMLRPEILPERAEFLSVLVVLLYAFLLFAAISALLAIGVKVMSIDATAAFPALFFGLFSALASARLLPVDSGFSARRILVFTFSLLIAATCYVFLKRKRLTLSRIAAAEWIFCAVAAYSLGHLYTFPWQNPISLFLLFTALMAVLLFVPMRILAGAAVVLLFLQFQSRTRLPEFAPPKELQKYRRVILIGVDGLSPQVVREMTAAGKLPALAALMKNGVSGNLHTLDVPFSPLVWNTIYTGTEPRSHGIMGFTRTGVAAGRPFLSLWLDNWTNSDWIHRAVNALKKIGAIRLVAPATAKNRIEPAIWNIVDQNGGDSIVIGGWTSYPPEMIRGTFISDYAMVTDKLRGTYYPPARTIDDLLLKPATQDHQPDEIARYVRKDDKIHRISGDLFRAASENTRFLFAYFCQIDAYGHHYGTYLNRKSTPPSRRAELLRIRDQVYTQVDSYLQQYLPLVDEGTLLIVCSDHGWHFDKRQHNYPVDGMILMMGAGVRKDTTIEDTVYGIAPTITYALGLPPSPDFHGMPIKQAFEGMIHEAAARRYNRATRFFEVQGLNDLDEQKMRELEDLQYINR